MRVILLKKVDDFITTLEKRTQSKWLHQLMLLEEYGQHLGMPHVKYILGGIKEIRVRGDQEVRAFFIHRGEEIVIVHAFIKKTKQIRKSDILIAQKRVAKLLTNL